MRPVSGRSLLRRGDGEPVPLGDGTPGACSKSGHARLGEAPAWVRQATALGSLGSGEGSPGNASAYGTLRRGFRRLAFGFGDFVTACGGLDAAWGRLQTALGPLPTAHGGLAAGFRRLGRRVPFTSL